MITKVAFVAHPTKNMANMKQFYGEWLGLEQSADFANMWCEFVAPDGKTVALDTFSAQNPEAGPYMALESDDIEGDLQRLKNHGVTVVRDLWANNNEDGRETCKMALVTDPDGNPVMLPSSSRVPGSKRSATYWGWITRRSAPRSTTGSRRADCRGPAARTRGSRCDSDAR